tara:strand:+ start:379 stop:699 length:321 start_codon:yes stop_codon:yes gene_type:complete
MEKLIHNKMNKKRNTKKKDFSNNKDWEGMRSIYSRSQQDFPIALGLWRVLQLKTNLIGRKPLTQIPPIKFQKLIDAIIRDFNILTRRKMSGEIIAPDIKEKYVAKI